MATPVSPPELVVALRAALAGEDGVKLALLFGSQARGTARDDSDVDVAVEADAGVDLLGLAARLSERVGREVQLTPLSSAGFPLLEVLLRDGLLLHEGRRHAWARWRTRAILETETDRANYERMERAFLKRVAERGVTGG